MGPNGRIEPIDQFRGFAILLMVLADYINNRFLAILYG